MNAVLNAHLVQIKYKGATETRGSRVALISKRFPRDRVAEGYNFDIGNTCRQGEAMLIALGYTILCSAECDPGSCYMAMVKEFKPLREALEDFKKNPRRLLGEQISDFQPEATQ